MRIGLFGGTFNPIHFGHLRTILEVRERFGLSRIYLIPSAIPPHKSEADIASPSDRLEMIRRAVGNDSDFVVSDVELMRTGPSYTIDTLSFFADALSKTDPCFLIVGLDAFLEIHTWKDFRGILTRLPLIVMGRPGAYDRGRFEDMPLAVADYLDFLAPGYQYDRQQSVFVHPGYQSVYPIGVTSLDISSSAIRSLVQRGRSIRFLVPEAVSEFISSKGLYQ
ncbi:MAG: nicotinate (nicotinamide) nucleotide adenylyltransferase [Deltaproteobacteria bacterium]|nr:nicotinate (nicotinamide) nucleotide adenylyltransferase [Deltaproteobacteria bacterium]